MALRWGPGPVFVFESLAAARRWTYYAARSVFALALMVALVMVWSDSNFQGRGLNDRESRAQLARLGQKFYEGIAGTQLTLILLAAPAAAAGAVCLDRARGTLLHVMVTDLSDAEIVLGKLASRLAPVFALVASALPVLALAGLLGGIVLEAVVTLFLVTLGMALLGCSAALLVSVRVLKAHEVLMAVYSALAIWLLAAPCWKALASAGTTSTPPDWFLKLNPYVLAYAPVWSPGSVHNGDVAVFLAGIVSISALLTIAAVKLLRREVTSGVKRSDSLERLTRRIHTRFFSWWPRPTLDGNPVAWREWHRNRPSRMARRIWLFYSVLMIAGTAMGLVDIIVYGLDNLRGGGWTIGVNALGVVFGLLFLSTSAPSALSEERVQGSLDVLLVTPLSTRTIVLGKWWGIFRIVPRLALLPALGAVVFAFSVPETIPIFPGRAREVPPVTTVERMFAAFFPIAWIFAHGAAVSSVGLAVATWIAKPGRAITLSVAFYLAALIGSILVVEMIVVPTYYTFSGLGRGSEGVRGIENGLISFSPYGGQIISLEAIHAPYSGRSHTFWALQGVVLAATFGFAAVVLGLTVKTFDRALGRVEEGRASPRDRDEDEGEQAYPPRYSSSSSPFT